MVRAAALGLSLVQVAIDVRGRRLKFLRVTPTRSGIVTDDLDQVGSRLGVGPVVQGDCAGLAKGAARVGNGHQIEKLAVVPMGRSLRNVDLDILELVHKLNERPFRKMAGSRAELYRMIDRPALEPLPAGRFVYAEWKRARVNLDYHVELDQHYYSTPYQLVGKEVDVRSTSGTVEIFYQGKRVASHGRSRQAHKATTEAGHRPKSHQQYLEWTPTRIIEWAGKAGPFTARLVEGILTSKPHPEMGYRSALGVIRLERKYGAERLEAASTRAVRLKWGHGQYFPKGVASGSKIFATSLAVRGCLSFRSAARRFCRSSRS